MPRQFDNRIDPVRLAAGPAPAPAPDQPPPDEQQVVDWLARLQLLQGVPFHYLVPDADMLPRESFRFFQIDQDWVDCLLDGAYSLGSPGVAAPMAEHARDGTVAAAQLQAAGVRAGLLDQDVPSEPPPAHSGFLLRSALVSGWPGAEITGYTDDEGEHSVQIVRLEHVSPSLLLCLFAGIVRRVDLQEPSEGVHFGVDADPAGQGWTKDVRLARASGDQRVGAFTGRIAHVPTRPAGEGGDVIQIDALAASVGPLSWPSPPPQPAPVFTAAEFGMVMTEGVAAVTFRESVS
jgi:hypothetical protein